MAINGQPKPFTEYRRVLKSGRAVEIVSVNGGHDVILVAREGAKLARQIDLAPERMRGLIIELLDFSLDLVDAIGDGDL